MAVAFASLALAAPSNAASWFVDKDAPGANTGTSWTNAWTSFAAVVWGGAGVKPGDTIYISGGASSKTYNEKWKISAGGTSDANRITIRPGQDANHNGIVVFDWGGGGDNGSGVGIDLNGQNYVTLNGEYLGKAHIRLTNLWNIYNKDTALCVRAGGCAAPIVEYVDFDNVNNAIDFYNGTTNFIVRFCNFTNLRGDHGINTNGANATVFDSHRIHDCSFHVLTSSKKAPGSTVRHQGPDGISPVGGGVSIYNCVFDATYDGNIVTSTQHSDMIQVNGGAFIKIYNNHFKNIGEAAIQNSFFAQLNPRELYIYNNVFEKRTSVFLVETCLRMYDPTMAPYEAPVKSLNNFKIFNNTFIDYNRGPAFQIIDIPPTATGSGNEFRNNLVINCGTGSNGGGGTYQAITTSGPGWSFSNNVYSYTSAHIAPKINGFSVAAWLSGPEVTGQQALPSFVSYTFKGSQNNLRLAPGDTVAVAKGVNLSQYFTTDITGAARPPVGPWTIGAYEGTAVAGNGPSIGVSPGSAAAGSLNLGQSVDLSFTVTNTGTGTLQGSASVSAPFAVVSGASYSLAGNQSQVITIRYNPTAIGNHAGIVSFTGAGGATATVSGSATIVPLGLVFEAESGILTPPFTVSGGAISQPAQTGITTGGRALYTFVIPPSEAGDYVVQAMVDAPNESANSFFVNVDAAPTDPASIWHVPITSGFEQRVVSWQGSQTWNNPEFAPKVFRLSAGAHQLHVYGREANGRIDRIQLVRIAPAPPLNPRVVPVP